MGLLNLGYAYKYRDGIRSICKTIDSIKMSLLVYVQTLDVHYGRYFILITVIFGTPIWYILMTYSCNKF